MTKNESVDAASMHPIVHTPGPWKYHDSGSIVMTADGQMSVADIRGFGRLEKDFGLSAAIKIMDKNGQLIAAAPELLQACQLVSLWMLGGQPGPHSDSIVLEQVKSAIRKATS